MKCAPHARREDVVTRSVTTTLNASNRPTTRSCTPLCRLDGSRRLNPSLLSGFRARHVPPEFVRPVARRPRRGRGPGDHGGHVPVAAALAAPAGAGVRVRSRPNGPPRPHILPPRLVCAGVALGDVPLLPSRGQDRPQRTRPRVHPVRRQFQLRLFDRSGNRRDSPYAGLRRGCDQRRERKPVARLPARHSDERTGNLAWQARGAAAERVRRAAGGPAGAGRGPGLGRDRPAACPGRAGRHRSDRPERRLHQFDVFCVVAPHRAGSFR